MQKTDLISNEEEVIIEKQTVKEQKEIPLNILEWIGTLFLLLVPGLNVIAGFVFLLLRKKSIGRSNFIMAGFLLFISAIILFGVILYICGDTLHDFVWDLFNHLYFRIRMFL